MHRKYLTIEIITVVRDVQHRKMSKAHRGIKTKYYFFGNGEPINLAFV